MNRPAWDDQFAETEDETRERWRRIKAKRKSEGKCWQCAKPIADCKCNLAHSGMGRWVSSETCQRCQGERFIEAGQWPCPECKGTGQVEIDFDA